MFFECCRFLNVCMQCSVDVTESLVELLRVRCRYAVIPPAISAHGHVMQQIIKTLFTNRFSQFVLQKIQQ